MIHFVVALRDEALPIVSRFRMSHSSESRPFPLYEADSARLIIAGTGKISAAAAAADAAVIESNESPRRVNTPKDAAKAASEPTQLLGTPPPQRPPTTDADGSATAPTRIPAAAPGAGIHAAPTYPSSNQKAPLGLQDSLGRKTGTARDSTPPNLAFRSRRNSTTIAAAANPKSQTRIVPQPTYSPTRTRNAVLTWMVRRRALLLTGGYSRRKEPGRDLDF